MCSLFVVVVTLFFYFPSYFNLNQENKGTSLVVWGGPAVYGVSPICCVGVASWDPAAQFPPRDPSQSSQSRFSSVIYGVFVQKRIQVKSKSNPSQIQVNPSQIQVNPSRSNWNPSQIQVKSKSNPSQIWLARSWLDKWIKKLINQKAHPRKQRITR